MINYQDCASQNSCITWHSRTKIETIQDKIISNRAVANVNTVKAHNNDAKMPSAALVAAALRGLLLVSLALSTFTVTGWVVGVVGVIVSSLWGISSGTRWFTGREIKFPAGVRITALLIRSSSVLLLTSIIRPNFQSHRCFLSSLMITTVPTTGDVSICSLTRRWVAPDCRSISKYCPFQ